MYKLVISDDEGKSTVVPLVRDEITIGRKEGNTIRLTERNVSRRHARVVKSNGRFVVEDLKSFNGVRVNGQRIGGETALSPGDQVQIGDYRLALQVESTDTMPDGMSPAARDADTAMIAAPGPPARLVMITPPAPGAEFALTSERMRIGRAEDLEIWVNHRSISREHAELQKEPDGGRRLIDLGSANGVRVNGKDVQNALLEAGDVVELGQVRFRFVGAGEHYAFDADRTVQMDALTVESPRAGKRTPVIAAGVIVLLAVVVAGALALWSGGTPSEPTVRQLESRVPEPDDRPAPTPTPPTPRGYDGALAACRAAIERGQYSVALQHADAALAERPADADAAGCRAQAVDGLQFEQAVAHLRRSEHREAYLAFERLAEGSTLRSRPEVEQAAQAYATQHLNEGQQQLAASPAVALEHAERVLRVTGITAGQRERAEALAAQARNRTAPAANPSATATSTPAGRRPRRSEGESPPAAAPVPSSSPSTPPPREEVDYQEQARQCNMNGDNACVIRLLGPPGRARTETSQVMLIEAYRARGQSQLAQQHMRTFVQRFPSSPRARGYQQVLAVQGGGR